MPETSPTHLILASASPRRRSLLSLTGWSFETTRAQVEEAPEPGESPEQLTRRLAERKARAAAADGAGSGWVLAADTEVVDRGRPLGKPADDQQAMQMLEALRGREHLVITSLVIIDPVTGAQVTETCRSRVPMRSYALEQAAEFVARGEAWDKAGAYAIQDVAFHPVDVQQMRDCFANVVGLPLCHLVRAMRRLGAEPPRAVPQACQQHTGYRCPVYGEILDGLH